MSAFTDDDVQAAMGSLADWTAGWSRVEMDQVRRQVRAVLAAVAPAIAARALREASEAIKDGDEKCNVKRSCHYADSITLTERARAIERIP